MTDLPNRVLALGFSLLLPALALAATPSTPKEVMHTVDAWKGHWKAKTTLTTAGGKKVTYSESINCTPVSMGRGVSCSDHYTVPGMGKMEYAYLISYDVDSKKVHLFSVGSPGEVHDHRCEWKDPKHLACEKYEGSLGGAPLTEEFEFTFDGDKVSMTGSTTDKDGTMKFESVASRGKAKM